MEVKLAAFKNKIQTYSKKYAFKRLKLFYLESLFDKKEPMTFAKTIRKPDKERIDKLYNVCY